MMRRPEVFVNLKKKLFMPKKFNWYVNNMNLMEWCNIINKIRSKDQIEEQNY